MLFALSNNNLPEIKNYHKKEDLYFSKPVFDGISEQYIAETDLECCYLKFNNEETKVEFVPSHHYDFFVYQEDDLLLVGTDINELINEVKDFSLTPNRVAIASVLTFGQVPEGMTLFNQINSFKGPYYGTLDLKTKRLEKKIRTYEPDNRLLDKDFFLDYYKTKLDKIGDYSLFYSSGVDSEFLRKCKTDADLIKFEYDSSSASGYGYLPLFKTLNHIDVHSINFPGEHKAWSLGSGKVVTGFGGDSSFAISDISFCSFPFFLESSGGPSSWIEEESTFENKQIVEGLTSRERSLLGKRKICGGDCSQNTIQWAWKESNAYVHNVLSDPVVATTFNILDKTYGNRFLLNYVSGRKNTNQFDLTYWDEFVAETYGMVYPTKLFEEEISDTETYYGKLRYLLELYFSIEERYYKVAL